MFVTFVTSNHAKFQYAFDVFKSFGIRLRHADREIVEPQYDTSLQVCRYKLEQCILFVEGIVLVEDSSVVIPVLDGFPGPYAKYMMKKLGNSGILKLMEGRTDRRLYFESSVAAYDPLSGLRFVETCTSRPYFIEKSEGHGTIDTWGEIGGVISPYTEVEHDAVSDSPFFIVAQKISGLCK